MRLSGLRDKDVDALRRTFRHFSFVREVRAAAKLPYPKAHRFNGQHYWEIGKKGYPIAAIRKTLRNHGRIVHDFVPWGSPYHHFFVLDVRPTAS